jgi:hypothetical protein
MALVLFACSEGVSDEVSLTDSTAQRATLLSLVSTNE